MVENERKSQHGMEWIIVMDDGPKMYANESSNGIAMYEREQLVM